MTDTETKNSTEWTFGGPRLAGVVLCTTLIALVFGAVFYNYAPTQDLEYIMAGFMTGAVFVGGLLPVVWEVWHRAF